MLCYLVIVDDVGSDLSDARGCVCRLSVEIFADIEFVCGCDGCDMDDELVECGVDFMYVVVFGGGFEIE